MHVERQVEPIVPIDLILENDSDRNYQSDVNDNPDATLNVNEMLPCKQALITLKDDRLDVRYDSAGRLTKIFTRGSLILKI